MTQILSNHSGIFWSHQRLLPGVWQPSAAPGPAPLQLKPWKHTGGGGRSDPRLLPHRRQQIPARGRDIFVPHSSVGFRGVSLPSRRPIAAFECHQYHRCYKRQVCNSSCCIPLQKKHAATSFNPHRPGGNRSC